MKNLENLNLQELSFEEQVNTDGGRNIKPIVDAVGYLLTAVGVVDAINDFKKGWNSVKC